MQNKTWRWVVGLIYIFLVAAIWIAASFVVQSVVDAGVSPFLVTYICNSLFVVYIPLVEIGRYLEDHCENLFFWRKKNNSNLQELGESEQAILLEECDLGAKSDQPNPSSLIEDEKPNADNVGFPVELIPHVLEKTSLVEGSEGIDQKGRWTRVRVAKVSLVICPFWFLAQLTFNLSLKYTTVTSNTILSTSSSLFTFLVSLVFLGEKFTWVKLVSVLLCMAGTIIVSLGDSETGVSEVASSPLLGDFLALVSAAMYAIYITLIRVKLPDDDGKNGTVSTAQFLGFLGLFNLFIFLPVALVLHFTMLEPFNVLTGEQFGLIVGKGLLDNVLSDYLWAKAVLLTTTTVATAGLTIQVPLAAVVDSLTAHAPQVTEYLGALAVMIGFAGINLPSKEADFEPENQNITAHQEQQHLPTSQRAADI